MTAADTTLYEGVPDGRQQGQIKPTRFRPRYRALTPEELRLHDELKSAAVILDSIITAATPAGRYRELALTALEEAVIWAVKGLTE